MSSENESSDGSVQRIAANIESGIHLMTSLTLQRVALVGLTGFVGVLLYTFWDFRLVVGPRLIESPLSLGFGGALLLAVVLGLIGGWFIRYVDSQSTKVYNILNDRIADLKMDIEDVRQAERQCQLDRIEDQNKFQNLILDLARSGTLERRKEPR